MWFNLTSVRASLSVAPIVLFWSKYATKRPKFSHFSICHATCYQHRKFEDNSFETCMEPNIGASLNFTSLTNQIHLSLRPPAHWSPEFLFLRSLAQEPQASATLTECGVTTTTSKMCATSKLQMELGYGLTHIVLNNPCNMILSKVLTAKTQSTRSNYFTVNCWTGSGENQHMLVVIHDDAYCAQVCVMKTGRDRNDLKQMKINNDNKKLIISMTAWSNKDAYKIWLMVHHMTAPWFSGAYVTFSITIKKHSPLRNEYFRIVQSWFLKR